MDDVIIIFFKSIGSASALKQQRYSINSSKTIYDIENTLKKAIGLQQHEGMFLYIGAGFCPTKDQSLKELYECFKTSSNELVISYGIQECWG